MSTITLRTNPTRRLFPIIFVTLNLVLNLELAKADQVFDIDKDGKSQPLTDGLLIMRHLFGFSGESLTQGVIGDEAVRKNPRAIPDYLLQIHSKLDVDGDFGLL